MTDWTEIGRADFEGAELRLFRDAAKIRQAKERELARAYMQWRDSTDGLYAMVLNGDPKRHAVLHAALARRAESDTLCRELGIEHPAESEIVSDLVYGK